MEMNDSANECVCFGACWSALRDQYKNIYHSNHVEVRVVH
jgi:hypothetical protein